MESTARAPGRVNLIGEHTDYNGGLCLPIAIPAGTTAHARPRPDGRYRVSSTMPGAEPWEGSLDDAAPGRIDGWAAYAAGTLWALRELDVAVPALEIAVDADVPPGSGLSSSASLEAAVAVAATVGRVPLDVLVSACRLAENDVVGAPTGGLDQTAVLHARVGHALLVDFANGDEPAISEVAFDPADAGLDLVVIDTRVRHAHADGGYGDRRAECERAAHILQARPLGALTTGELASRDTGAQHLDGVARRRARHVVREVERVRDAVDTLAHHDWAAFGLLMTASHHSLRDDFEVSCDELDVAVDAALAAGALGARMTGGGFGGCAIALVPRDHTPRLRRAISGAFAARTWQRPDFRRGSPAAGARLISGDDQVR
ncbi:galactokinase [Nocardioides sp. R-C-SC26]|uniref:galactokinase n=1 Tax=Nocardioides sp. R-C-SC26 TaxID=2870414 RepID=UPI001E2E3721|nr:galactokinase [Nocardioides sp. R-C-SC26]